MATVFMVIAAVVAVAALNSNYVSFTIEVRGRREKGRGFLAV